jgi:hypothetical protein
VVHTLVAPLAMDGALRLAIAVSYRGPMYFLHELYRYLRILCIPNALELFSTKSHETEKNPLCAQIEVQSTSGYRISQQSVQQLQTISSCPQVLATKSSKFIPQKTSRLPVRSLSNTFSFSAMRRMCVCAREHPMWRNGIGTWVSV